MLLNSMSDSFTGLALQICVYSSGILLWKWNLKYLLWCPGVADHKLFPQMSQLPESFLCTDGFFHSFTRSMLILVLKEMSKERNVILVALLCCPLCSFLHMQVRLCSLMSIQHKHQPWVPLITTFLFIFMQNRCKLWK